MALTIESGSTNLSNFDKRYIAKTADSSSKSNKKSNTNEAYLRTKYYVGFSKGLYDTKYFHEAYEGPTTSGKFVQSRKNNLKEEKNKEDVVKPQNKTVMMVENFVETIEIGNMEHDILETKYVVGGNYFLQL
jgi:hypothetical protein